MREQAARDAAKACDDKWLIAWIRMHLNKNTPISDFLLPILKTEAAKRKLSHDPSRC